jgi:MraZ protein
MAGSGAKWWKVGDEPVLPALRPRLTNHQVPLDVRRRDAVFLGEFRHAVDEKGRLAVPARFRADLEGGCVVARWLDTCLAIFPMPAWEVLATKVGALPMTDPNARLLQRRLFAGAFETEIDKQGRVLVPQTLRAFAELQAEAMVLGLGKQYLEVWSPPNWDEYKLGLEDSSFAAAVSGLGI